MKTTWQTFADGSKHIRAECSKCGAFLRYLKQPAKVPVEEVLAYLTPAGPDAHPANTAPLPESWEWLGHVRQSDGLWRPVALCSTLAACWDSLLTFPGRADLLCCPVAPVPRGEGADR
jgi:hypothetical protein